MEVNAIVGLVGIAFVNQIFRDPNHFVHIVSAPWVVICTKNVQGIHVFVIRLDVGIDKGFPIPVQFICSDDDFVIDVGEVLNVMDIIA